MIAMKGNRKRRERKTVQLNMRITPTLKQQIDRLASEYDVSVVDLIEIAVRHSYQMRPIRRDWLTLKADAEARQ